jgi:hypothetical protein
VPNYGQRAPLPEVDHPLSTLSARYAAISAERDDVLARMDQFLSVLEQDSNAADRLLYAAEMETWMGLQPSSPSPPGSATISPPRTGRCPAMFRWLIP